MRTAETNPAKASNKNISSSVIFTLSGTCEKKQKVYLLNYQNPPVLAPNWNLLFVSNS